MGAKTKETAQKRLKRQITGLARVYANREFEKEIPFIPGETYIPPSGKVIGSIEIANAVEAALDGHLTEGRWTETFEKALAKIIKTRYVSMTNSGSSANLLAVSALTSPLLADRKLRPGDEVIVAAASFPTTLNPIIQNGLQPVFIDVELDTLVPSVEMIAEAIGKKTRAIFLAHTLGNPAPIFEWANNENSEIFVIEDNCDALGSLYNNKPTGGFGLLATQSFYPAHHITCGEGGAVYTNSPTLNKIVESFKGWGRSCWCAPGKDNTCGKRFDWQLNDGTLQDHKHLFSHIGYNLKATDFQAAIGLAQLDRLSMFVRLRRKNFAELHQFFQQYEDLFILPRETRGSKPSWFGYALTIRDGAPFNRTQFTVALERRHIGTRTLFGGNLLKHPAYSVLNARQIGLLEASEKITKSTFWIGLWPGIDNARLEYMKQTIEEIISGF